MLASVLAAALRFRVLLAGIAAGLILVGVISLPNMHVDVLPELGTGPILEVQTEALGLSSQEVEQYVTVPMENNLLDGIMDVWDVRSQSVPGLSTIDLYFEPGTSLLHARQLVTERLTAAYELPNISKPPLLIQPLSSTGRVLLIGLRSTTMDPLELSYLARWVVKPRLSGVAGVANVAIFGERDRQIQVLVDPAVLAAKKVTLDQIIETAGDAQLVSPLSYLQGSSPGTGGFLDGPNQRLDIRPVLPLSAPSDLAAVPVSGAPKGLRLGDVATVVEGNQPLIGDAIVGGGAGLVLEVQKLPSANVLAVTDGLDRALDDLRPALTGVQIDTSFFRPASYVSSALHNLALVLLIAAALALVALAALFLDARALVIAALSLALSLLVAALVLQALGYTLNALVVAGMLIGTAVVVDDAVGATQQIVTRLRARGAPGPQDPVHVAVLEVCTAMRSTLGYATLFALLAVAPVLFSTGLTATFVHPLAIAFALMIVASMVVAVTFTSALGLLLFERGPRPRRREVSAGDHCATTYRAVLSKALAIPRPFVAAICLLSLTSLAAFPFLNEPSPPTFLDRNLVVQWDGPVGASLTEMDRVTQRVVDELRSLPSVADTAAILGRAVSGDEIVDVNSGQIFVSIKTSANYGQAMNAVRAIVEGTPGMRGTVSTYENDVLTGVLAPASQDVTVRVYGQEYGELDTLASQVKALMSNVRGVGSPHVYMPTMQPNIEVSIDNGAALGAGVLAGDARREASTLVSGLTVGNFFEQQAVFDVVVRGVPSVRSSLGDVRDLLLDTSGGGHVRLSQIATVGIHPDPVDIQHEALSRYVDVTARVSGESVDAAGAAIQRHLGQVKYPLAYHAEVLGGTPASPTSHAAFLSYVLAAVIGMLLLAQAAFDSWGLATLFLLSLPMALAGGVVVALATGEIGSLGSCLGLLAVFVFAGRQGMLQIAHIRRLQARCGGALTREIVLDASAERLAPCLAATAVAAALMLPFVVIGNVAGNEITHVAAAVILGGLVTSALLNQVLLPVAYLKLGPASPASGAEPPEGVIDLTGPTGPGPVLRAQREFEAAHPRPVGEGRSP
jgi:multidrug efflux pump subunit AcrB